jgi:hypothetical protein
VSDSQIEYVLLPSRRDAETKPLTIKPREWRAALDLSWRNGYTPPDVAGMSRAEVRWLVKALEQGVAGIKEPQAREDVNRLLRFCRGDGILGFTLERRWQRATAW